MLLIWCIMVQRASVGADKIFIEPLMVSELREEVVYGACYETRLNEAGLAVCATPNVHIWVLLEPIHFSLCTANKEDRRWMIKR